MHSVATMAHVAVLGACIKSVALIPESIRSTYSNLAGLLASHKLQRLPAPRQLVNLSTYQLVNFRGSDFMC